MIDSALTINTVPPYPVYIGNGLLKNDMLLLSPLRKKLRLIIITDSTVYELYGKILEQTLATHSPLTLIFPAGEVNKTRETKTMLEDSMLAASVNRDSCILSLGGGVVSDLAGFVAATYCRGIPVIYLPTTLLAMVDACVGGKTGVNTHYGKNLIGVFHQPLAVFMDVSTLSSLPASELNNGFAEMLKHALLESEDMVDAFWQASLKPHPVHWLLADSDRLVRQLAASVKVKKHHVEADEFDVDIRQLLNFGHTLGHAVEKLSHYTICHGHAVAVGMLIESYLSLQQGFLSPDDFVKIEKSLTLCGFSLQVPYLEDTNAVLKALKLDKKAKADGIKCVLLGGIGKPPKEPVRPVTAAQIEEALAWYHQRASRQ